MSRQPQRLLAHLFSSRALNGFLALSAGFFLLYALGAQGGGEAWGDSAEFQEWVLRRTEFVCGAHFSNAHPFYVAFCRLVASTQLGVTLVSSFFGALSVGGFFLCTRRVGLSVVFGLSHMLWWNSSVAEVQTMNLAFTAFETWCLLTFLDTRRTGWLIALAVLAGLHLNVHNFALLAYPVYAVVLDRQVASAAKVGRACATLAGLVFLWALAALPWLWACVVRGPADVLVGNYGAKVAGLWPSNLTLTAFNLALAAMSFFPPVALWWWSRKSGSWDRVPHVAVLVALFALNFLFFIRYFVPDQATFLLPTLFFAYLLVSTCELRRNRLAALLAMQVLLPLLAWQVLLQLPTPDWKAKHAGRNDAAYFALPWKKGVSQ